MSSSLKVLIVGGGIAGPALAFWLARIGCAVTVVERSPQERHTGQQIDIRGYGVDVIRKMGILEAVRAHIVKEPGTLMVDREGKRRAYFAMRETGRGDASLSSEYEIMRGDLCRVITDLSTKEGAVYRYGAVLKEMKQGEDGVRVRFEGTETEEVFDLVAGCDGVRSATRRMMLGEGAADPFVSTSGAIAWGSVPTEEGDTNDFTIFPAAGKRVIATRQDKPDCLRVIFITSGLPEDHPIRVAIRTGDSMGQRKAWAEHFRGIGWKSDRFTRDILESPLAEDWHGSEMGQVRMSKWYDGRVALVGDAGYSPSPAGWGTAMAFTGAYVLAGELARHCGLSAGATSMTTDQKKKAQRAIPEALVSYDRVLRPLVTKVQKAGNAGEGLSDSQFSVNLFLFIVGWVERLKLDQLLMRWANGGGSDFGWKLPEYAELGSLEGSQAQKH